MSKIPKNNQKKWPFVVGVIIALILIDVVLASINGPYWGGFLFGSWVVPFLLIWSAFWIVKKMVSTKVRSLVDYEEGDADVFTSIWSDIICIVIMGAICNIVNKAIGGNVTLHIVVDAALFVPFYFIYNYIYKAPEIELYKADRNRSGNNDKRDREGRKEYDDNDDEYTDDSF